MSLNSFVRRLDRLAALTADTGRAHYIWRYAGETAEQAIERVGMQGRKVVVIGWNDRPDPKAT